MFAKSSLWLYVPTLVLTLASDISGHEVSLLSQSMTWMDSYYDPKAAYLYATALNHETRSSAWYAAGLLARNNTSDALQANRIIRAVIAGQYKDPSKQWFGTYQKYPEEPPVGSNAYPAVMYSSWDPNWRGFIGSTFIVMLEEFSELIEERTRDLMMESLTNATVGDSYRVGGVDDDNLYPSYSNPAIMRAFVSGWTGRRTGDANMTRAGEVEAQSIVDLFNRDNTLSEFNSGTYAGVSLFALTLWAKYMDVDSVMGQNAERMIRYTWASIASLYNAELRNVAGPWDRTYGYDMNRYLSILALHIWTIVGKERAPIAERPFVMSHEGDFAIAPLIAILAPYHNSLLNESTIAALTTFPGTHTVHTSAFSPPWDVYPRNITTYMSASLTIGAESFSEEVIGGPSKNSASFNPAVAQWKRRDGSVGWLSLYAEVEELAVTVGEAYMDLAYPRGNSSSRFTFLVGAGREQNVQSWDDVDGVAIMVTGSVATEYAVSFNGENGGAGKPIKCVSIL
ncbi:hypothetical protein EJ05DRAFT_211166 [Pseudovirgaria hyperparasitica]|uniref:DUF1793-domain-containing protein n=1 Tax=Pseudovirgaria hyperparasitica TaxID=470096 RepID=A0A6A6VT39_9PEZI|nr:uncharacterized protein EJ05DRAFT_211166 [Pseudovirgaria hyperparasitica]KAF2753315.1 hypothetical protein EJ05DRAFT_211166 [Pseudovirgaria hyperparasitica]